MDKTILRMWLKAGYVENGITYPSRKGTPQGEIISPTFANMTLDGLEEVVRSAVPRRNRVNFIRYADDFIVTGKSKCLLEEKVKPAVIKFLAERGLTLSEEKTKLTHIKNGFTFLGQPVKRANLQKAWQETAYQAIERGSPRPHPEGRNNNHKTRQRRFQSFERQARKRLMVLHAAPSLEALMLNPGNKFHALKGDRKGQFAISINKQWRVCFEWHDFNAFNVKIVDYH